MSYAERLAQVVNTAPSRVVVQLPKKAYDWSKEANNKRSIR